jgi:cell division inhibitor SepF
MPGFIKKTAVYLGLSEGEDPYAYEEYEEEFDEAAVRPLGPVEQDGYEEAGQFPAESEARPLFLGEPRRSAEPDRAQAGRNQPDRTEASHAQLGHPAPADRSQAGHAQAGRDSGPRESASRRDSGEYARLAPIALVSERDDRTERYGSADRPLSVAALSSRPLAFDGGSGGGAAGAEAYRITTLHPRTYNEARTIGEHFRDGTPVIMNLTEMSDGDAKRLVDFAAGLVFGLRGSIERVTQRVFLLSPANVDVTAEDKARIAEGGFFNQS